MATIKEVADLAGVSIATVSNYLNGTKPVKANTKDKIVNAIEKLNYIPNYFAKNLKENSYNDVGVILPNFNDSYYVQIFQGIEKIFQGSNYFVNVALSSDIPDIEKNMIDNFLKKNVCGIILVTCQPDNYEYFYKNFIDSNKPLVLIDRQIDNLDTNFICFDNRNTLKHLASGLLSQGIEDIVLITGPKEYFCENECLEGYKEAFEKYGKKVSQECIYHIALNKEDAFRCTANMLKEHVPEAIITTSETSAKGIVESIKLIGYRVPEDIMVITLGEEHWNKYTCTFSSLNTIRPAMIMGENAATLMKEQIKSPITFESQRVILKDRIIDNKIDFNHIKANITPGKSEKRGVINILMLETPQVNALKSLLPHFEKTAGIKPNITILPHQFLLDRIVSEHKIDYAEDELSDVIMFDIPWLYYLSSTGVLANITEYVDSTIFNKDIYMPDCFKFFGEFEKNYYGVPFMYAPQIFYYRKDLFNDRALQVEFERKYNTRLRPPRTWTEFNAIAEFFTKKYNPSSPVSYGTTIPAAYVECFIPEIYMRLWSYGVNIFDKNLQVDFDNPQTLKAYISFFKTLNYAAPNYQKTDDVDVVNDFINGKTAMLITYPSFITDAIDLQKSSIRGKIGYDHVPGKTPILGGWSLGISSKSSKKDLAFDFINWACGEKIANYFTLLEGQSAIEKVNENDELVQLYPWLPLHQSTYKHTKPVIPPYKKGKKIIPQDKIEFIICKLIYSIMESRITIPDAIKETQKQLVELFESYGYPQNSKQ